MQPWAERGSGFAQVFFLVLSVTRRRPPLGQVVVGTLNHATWKVYSPKAFETLIHENVTHIVFFIVCKIYFLLVLLMDLHAIWGSRNTTSHFTLQKSG